MSRYQVLALSFAAFCCAAAPVLAGPRVIAVPPDSFINQHVDTVPQMTRQVTLDPVVRRRLARHFHTSGPAIVRYIQNNLVIKRTPHAGRFLVYCLSRTGREYTINVRLPAGTPMFVLRSTGKPILKLACGNPMVASLPSIVEKKAALGSPPQLVGLPVPASAKVAPELASEASSVVPIKTAPGVYLMPAPITKVAGGLYEMPGHGKGFPLGYLAALPLLGVRPHHGGTGGTGTGTGGNTGSGTGNNTGNNTGTGPGSETGGNTGNNTGNSTGTLTGTGTSTGISPVPEPSTPVAFAVGGAGLALLLAARRRSRKHLS